MPQLDFAFLADAAEAEPGRKLYVLGGGIDSISAVGYPVVHPHLALVMRVLVHPSESGRTHRMEITLVDTDGGHLAQVQGEFTGPPAPQPLGRDVGINMVLNFVNVRFESPGDYAFEILINGQHQKSLPLRLVPAGTQN